MKKIIALLLALIMVFSLVACGAKEEAPAAKEEETKTEAPKEEAKEEAEEEAEPEALPYEGIKLKTWMAPMESNDVDGPFWEEALAKFEEMTGAEVECEIVGWSDIATKYVTGFMTDDAADVLYTVNSVLYDLINQGFLLDLTPYWTEEEIADENYWEATEYAGKHYMAPFVGGAAYRTYVYNMDILNECGVTEVPTTWDELLEVCEAVQNGRPDVYTLLLPISGNNNAVNISFSQFMYQAGGSYANEDLTAYTLNTPEAKEGLTFLKTLVDEGYVSTDCLSLNDDQTGDLFVEGKAAITCMGSPFRALEGVSFEWFCTSELSNVQSAVYNAVDTIAVNANTEHKEAAVALLKYMRSAEVMAEYSEKVYANGPILKSYPDFIGAECMEDVFAHPERSMVYPLMPQSNTVNEAILTNMQLVVMGSLTVDEALEQIQAVADKAVE